MSRGENAGGPAPPALDVLLVHHPTRNRSRPILIPAVGLVSLADFLDSHGLRAQAVNLGVEESVDPAFDPVEYALQTGARVVGLSVHWFFQLPDSLELARRLRARCPELIVVLGGFSASYFGRELVAEHPEVDAVVRGDGELPFLRLCQAVLAGERRWDGLPNLWIRGPDGAPRETPFTHALDEAGLAALRPARLELLKNRAAAARLAVRMAPRRFEARFEFERKSVLVLAPTRGCRFACPLCGGNLRAQQAAFHRDRPLFQPPESVLANLREAMDYGIGNFYLSSDPEPNGPYYFELFRRIREERLDIQLLFDSWSLPSETFVEDFRRTFRQGMISLSPETADEEVRRRTKGPLAYSNEELLSRLRFIWERDLVSQVFFGYFLPGDTAGTIRATRRLAHALENERSEAFYLAFSTDPGSPVQLAPEEHDMHLELHTLRDYLAALPRERAASNLIAHRPRSLSAEAAAELALEVEVDQLLGRILPLGARLLRALDGAGGLEDALLLALVADVRAQGGIPSVARLAEQAVLWLAGQGARGPEFRALAELARLEGLPYALLAAGAGALGRHYTSACPRLELEGDALRAFLARPGLARGTERFSVDVLALSRDLRAGRPPRPVARELALAIAVDPAAGYVAFPAG